MFSEVGSVRRAAIIPAQPGRNTTYGFVEFSTVREAEAAIQKLNNKDMGRSNRLVVRISESKKNREERLRIREDEAKFVKTLHCGKHEVSHEHHDSDEEAEKALSNPLQPRYISNNTQKSVEGVSSGENSLNSSGGASSGNAPSDKMDSHLLLGMGRGRMLSPVAKVSPGSSSSSSADAAALMPCTVCQKPTNSRCSRCKTYYCSTKCQRDDWPRHREECGQNDSPRKPADTVSPPPSATATNTSVQSNISEIRIAEDSDDEGFVFDCPSTDELVAVKELLHQAKDKGDLASSVAEDASSGRISTHAVPSDSPHVSYGKSEQPTSGGNSLLGELPVKTVPSMEILPSKTPLISPLKSLSHTLIPSQSATTSSAFPNSIPTSALYPCSPIPNDSVYHSLVSTPMSVVGNSLLPSPRFACEELNIPLEDCFVPVKSILSQFDLLGRPLPSLPPTSCPPPEFLAIVSFYYSPTQFNVVIPSVESKQALQFIRNVGLTPQPGKLLASQLSQGSKCGYKDKRGDFIRVTVNRVLSPENILVQSYDFGGIFSVPVCELRPLPEELVLIPCLTHKCSLQHVFISEQGRANITRAFRDLKQLVNGEPIMVENLSRTINHGVSCLLCSLKSKDGIKNLSDVLLSSPYVTSVSKQDRGISDQTPTSLKLSYAASKVRYHSVEQGTTVVILPTVVINPSIIWAQVVHPSLPLMEIMHKDLNNCYPPPDASSNPYMPIVGEICVAKYSQDQKYYRAEVLCVNHSGMVDIRFTETGRTESVTASQLHHIQPVFLTMPKQARKFSLCGVAPVQSITWTDNAIAFLKDKILNRHITVKIVSIISSEAVVEMFDPDLDNQLVRNSLVLLGHARVSHKDKTLKCSSNASLRGVSTSILSPYSPETEIKSHSFESSFTPLNSPTVQQPFSSCRPASAPSSHFQPSPASRSLTKPLKDSLFSEPNENMPVSNTPSYVSEVDSVECGSGSAFKPTANFRASPISRSGSFTELKYYQSDKINTSMKSNVPLTPSSRIDSHVEPLMLSESDCVKVSLSHVNTLERFFVQLVEPANLAKVEVMLDKIERTTLVALPQEQYKKGKICLCRYSEDNQVHRAMIIFNEATKVVVIFKDYGNLFECTHDHIFQITDELLELPFQAISCSLNQVKNPAGNKKEWDPVALSHFKDILESGQLQIEVVKIAGILHIVDMKVFSNSKGVVDVLKEMCEAGFVMERPHGRERHSSTRSVTSPPPHIAQCKDRNSKSNHGASCEEVNRTQNVSSIGRTRSPKKNKENNLGSSSRNIHPSVSSMKKLSLPQTNKPVDVIVCEVVSLQEIYIQVLTGETASAMTEVSDALASFSISDSFATLSSSPPVGSLCCAKFSQDQMWYRCEVESMCEDKISVFFVDFGNRDSVALSDVVPCPVQSATVPAIAIKCGLAGLSSISVQEDKAVDFLRDHTADCKVTVEVVSESESTPQVLMRTSDFDIVEEMAKQGTIGSPEADLLYPLVADLEKMQLPTNAEMFKVNITEVISPNEVYLQIATADVSELLIKIGEGINAKFKSHHPQSPSSLPNVGSLCCARFSVDKHWYRAVVLQALANSCTVLFVDYGNKETVTLSDISACPSEFSSLPLVAVKCGLSGLTGLAEAELVTSLRQHTTDCVLSAKKVGEYNGIPLLKLQNNEGISLLDEMSKLNLISHTEGRQSLPLVKDVACVPLPNAGTFQIVVTEVTSPSKFYVQVATADVQVMLSKISEGVNNESHPLQPLSSPPEVSSLCCAKFSVDMQWYRVEICQVNQDSYLVFFVDYGNKDEVLFSDLALCPSELSCLPLVAVECGLSSLPTKLASSNKLAEHLQRSLCNSLLTASVTGNANNIPQLTILKGETNVLDEMSKLGLIGPSFPLVKDVQCMSLPSSGPFQVLVTEVVSPSKFYVQVATTEVQAVLNKISEGINNKSHPLLPFPSPPEVGVLCCAKFSVDMQWYRVEVREINQEKCHVYFVDYGNREEAPLSDLALCPSEFCCLPLVAVECGLSCLPPKLTSSDKLTARLQQYLVNNLVSASVTANTDSIPQLSILKGETNVLDEISKLGLVGPSLTLVKDVACVLLPSSGPFQVLVTEVVSPSKLYVQVATTEVQAVLSKITEGINNESHPLLPFPPPPEVGVLCCAKFSVDMQWYRVEVCEINQEKCHVYFVDYGNREEAPLSDMALCPSELCCLPLVAVECGLSGLPPKLASTEKLTAHLQQCLLNSLVSATLVGKTNNTPQLEICKDGNSLLDDMSKLGLLETPVPKQCINLVKDMDCIPLPHYSSFKAMVAEVVNAMEFYVQVATTEVGGMMNKIMEGINNKSFPLQPLPSPPKVGSLCCAKFSEDLQWYRVEILEVKENSCCVFFVDYGNNDTVLLTDMAVCPSELSCLPLVAVKCGLSGLPPEVVQSEKVTGHLQQCLSNSLVSASVVSQVNNTPLLEIYKDGLKLVDDMSKHGLLKVSSTKPLFPLVKDMEHVALLHSGFFQVMISEVVSPNEFFIQVATTEVADLLKKITEGINNESHPLQSLPSPPEVGALYCAKFSLDMQWYRVEVLEAKDKSCLVKFVDYGNSDAVSLSDMAICPSELSCLPLVAVKCSLSGLPSFVSTPDATQFFQQYNNAVLSARIVCEDNNILQLELLKGKTNLLDEMSKLLISGPAIVPKHLVKNMRHVSLPNIGIFQVMVTEVVSLSEIYVQVATKEVGDLLKKVTEGINNESSPLQPLPFSPEVGVLCCAKFSEDMQWYRVEVLQVKESSCLVFFVDYGNKEEVPLSDYMAVCPLEFSSMSRIAVKCCLSGLPSSMQPMVESTQLLKQLTCNSLLSAKLIGKTSGIPELELHNSDANLLDEVLNLDLATKPSSSHLLPLVTTMERKVLPTSPDIIGVSVTEIVSLSEIYIQMATQEVAMVLNELSDGLNEYFDSNASSFSCPPPVGSLCCAKFSQDSLWYRAEVLAVEDDRYTVYFIDYGNRDILPLSNMVACPSQFALVPVIAVCCGIGELSPASVVFMEQAIHFLKEITYEVEASVEVIGQIDGIPQVKLSVKGMDVIFIMMDKGLVTAPHPTADLKMLHFPPISDYVQCLVCEVVNLSEFYIHVDNKERSDTLEKIDKTIESLFASGPPKPLIVPPSVGDLCLAKFSQDNLWYRVQVNAVNGKTCEVLYLDYRNTETVDLSNMVACPAQLAALPQLAIQCGLGGLQSNYTATEENISLFKQLTSNNCVLSAIHLCDVDAVPQIELMKDNKNFLSLLGLPRSSFPMVASMKKLGFPSSSEPFQLLVCELVTPREVYVQVNNDDTTSSLKYITKGLEQLSDPEPLSTPPPVGSLCCAKFLQDDIWYRARVVSISSDSCKVFFIDYGNSEEVSLTQLTSCPSDLLEFPVVAVKCSLHGIDSPGPPQSVWSSSAMNILKTLTYGHLLNASVISDKLCQCPVVQLADISNGTLISVEFQKMYQSSGSTVVSLRKCQVTELNNPGSLYFQYIQTDNANNLSLLNKLQEVYACPSAFKDFTPTVGSLCCAQFSGDLCWYRCKVTSVTKDTVGLYYIDFGTVESLPRNKIYHLDEAFTSLPPMAVHGEINGIQPKQGNIWGKGAIDKLTDLCDKKFLYVLAAGRKEEVEIVAVDLFEDENRLCNIADSLVASGHAVYA